MALPEVDKFGKLVVTQLRDSAIDFYDGLAKAHWKSQSHQQLQADLATLTAAQRDIARGCVVACVDTAMHDFLFALTESNDFAIEVDGKNIIDLSDGLHGEPYTEDGWIAKFGKHPEGNE